MSNYAQLKEVLNDLFELNKADLDFGIYRIINQKRKQVNEFIDKQLPNDIRTALSYTQSVDKAEVEKELKTLKKTLEDAGVVAEESPKYKILYERLQGLENTDVLEQDVFSHLANFFRRYYKDGDFISMRRYKKDVYAIPYEGEEVKLHWANHDQYYIKSSENFKQYSFTLPDEKKVTFQLKEVSTEQNNNKLQGDAERRFALFKENPLEEKDDELLIYFIYEPLPKSIKQEALISEALDILSRNIPQTYKSVFTPNPTEKNKTRTLLEKHLTDYVTKNSFDYFIHKDLGGFLTRELDFYIKNEVLYIDDINAKQTDFFGAQLSKVKAIKVVAQNIINFLAQIENFQKKLWLKKKFVISTDYCITLDRVPNKYYAEIFQNKNQLEEWRKLYGVDIKNEAELSQEKYLLLDTKLFDESFKDRLLAEFEDLDENVNGLLINSENYQALNLLHEKFYQKINGIHIDPPYNTNTSGFLYKNSFQSSSWLSFMYDRISISLNLLNDIGSLICHIDENEYERLFLMLEVFDLSNSGTVIWDKRNPMTGGTGIATQHEYMIWKNKTTQTINVRSENVNAILNKIDELKNKYGRVSEESKREYVDWLNGQEMFSGGELAYRYIDDEWNVYQSVSLRAPEKRENEKFHQPLIHPVTKKPCAVPPNGFSRTPETLQEMISKNLILFGSDESTQPRQKMILKRDKKQQLNSVIQDATRGKSDLDKLGLAFPYNHSVQFYKLLIDATVDEENKYLIDFFAGSGTSGHAIIELNREDGQNRRYILVEMGSYFNSVTKPRIEKAVYSSSWKGGKPQEKNGSTHIIKYQMLESYEDTLNNLYLKSPLEQGELDLASEVKEEYLLKYMLEIESRDHLFNLEMFRKPFDYQLKVTENNELKSTKVDLVETFNYLIGLFVNKIQRVKDIKVVEGVTRSGVKTLVIWRDIETTTNEEVEKLIRRFYDSQRTKEFQQIYINGDHHLENLRQEGDQFKIKLIEETFFKKMFNETEL